MKEYTFKVKRDKKKSKLSINMGGQLNVNNMQIIKTELSKAAVGFKKISISINNIEDTDLTLVQMLKAFQISCKKNDIELSFEIELNDNYKSLFDRAGLLTLLN